jgi:hypothetical protein
MSESRAPASGDREGIMAVCCESCGTVVRVDSDMVVLTRYEWYSHCVGTCPSVFGRLGESFEIRACARDFLSTYGPGERLRGR